jgi:hypothetical protein
VSNVSNFFDDSRNFKSLTGKSLSIDQRPAAREIKKQLEQARNSYPAHLRSALDNKLCDYGGFRGAVWELYFWDLLKRGGKTVDLEKSGGVGAKTIDFFWQAFDQDIRLEVTSRSLSQRQQKLSDAQNGFYKVMAAELPIRTNLVIISLKSISEVQPNVEYLVREIMSHYERNLTNAIEEPMYITDDASDWEVTVTFGSEVSEGLNYAPLVLEPLELDHINFGDYRDTLKEKFSKFARTPGSINIVAIVGSHVTPPSIFEAVQILYGSPGIRISTRSSFSENVLTDVSYFAPGNEDFNHISAVMLGFGAIPGYSSLVRPIICLNPNSHSPFEPKYLPLDSQIIRFNDLCLEELNDRCEWVPLNSWM